MAETVPEFIIYELWWKSFPTLVSKKLKAFAFICIVFISGRLNSAQKICSTRKWKFYNVLQQSRIWVMVDTVPDFSIKGVESFCFHLHCIYKGKTKQRSTIHKNTRKICSTRKWKFYNIWQKTCVWVMAEIVPDFTIEEVERLLLSFALYL